MTSQPAPLLRILPAESGLAPGMPSAPEAVDPMPAQSRADGLTNGLTNGLTDDLTDGLTQAEAASQISIHRGQGDMSVDHWNLLFRAVETRLRMAVTDANTGELGQSARTTVLECVTALKQLHSVLGHEQVWAELVDRELREAHSALARIGGNLSDTQASEGHGHHLALHDSLTALPNRNHFRDCLDHVLAPPDPASAGPAALAVLHIDLNGFRLVNDRHGHGVGDELLRIVAQRLVRSVRAGDMVCRLGGDEFACLLIDLGDFSDLGDHEVLSHLANKLFVAVSAPMNLGALNISVQPSIGIAMCPGDGIDADTLLRNADAAMYRAKRRKLGHVFFDRHIDC